VADGTVRYSGPSVLANHSPILPPISLQQRVTAESSAIPTDVGPACPFGAQREQLLSSSPRIPDVSALLHRSSRDPALERHYYALGTSPRAVLLIIGARNSSPRFLEQRT